MGLIKKILYKYIIPPVGMMMIYLLGITCRTILVGKELEQALLNKETRSIYALWHGRIFFMPYRYRWQGRLYCLVSPSMDGEIIARILRMFRLNIIRGSSYKEGRKAFRELIKVVKEGNSAAIIVDGSRGPAFKVQGGVIHLAMLGGVPILPLTYSAEKAIVLKSWDRFIIPKPFSRVVVIYGEPLYVSRDLSDEQMEEKRIELEQRLNEITEVADHYFE
jgi:lysophospholipid acyltransferase (LPLAT)-like uncharacterized protein